jgi:hypothetical protein
MAMERSEGDRSLKNPVTPPGIDPGAVQLVAQCLNHYATPGPLCIVARFLIHNVTDIETTVNSYRRTHGCKQRARCGILVGNQYSTLPTHHLHTALMLTTSSITLETKEFSLPRVQSLSIFNLHLLYRVSH